jgi:glycerol-3-phosphate dehydrogenase
MKREEIIQTIENTRVWDVLVIGGGASGLGTALEAAARGYRTLLLEAHDYAKGTSSRSTKLVHGGVRYLAQGNIPLVKEALHERGILKRNAPHLVHDRGFLIAAYNWWSIPFYGLGLKVYDFLAGKLNLQPSRHVSREKALELMPTLKKEGLKGGVLYFDGQFDDSRLAISLMHTIHDHGGVALNHAPVIGLVKEDGQVVGATFRDAETGQEYTVHAKSVVNATGVFVDDIRRMEDATVTPMLSPSQGVHVVVKRKFLPGNSAMMVPRTEDGRVLFAVPWHDYVMIGTTDTAVPNIEMEPRALPEEIEFILHTAAQYISPAPTRADVLSVYAGLRPLVKADGSGDTKSLSRSHVIRTSEGGLVTLTGGKWTIYRRMGQDTIDEVIKQAGLPSQPSTTEGLKLHGWSDSGLDDHWKVYGTDAATIQTWPGADIRLSDELPNTEAEVRWAIRQEQARTVEDVLARRIRALFLNAHAARAAAPRVAQILAEELGKDEAWQQEQLREFDALVEGYLLPS